MKKTIISLAVFIIILLGFWFFFIKKDNEKVTVLDYKNTTYVVDGKSVKLIDGISIDAVVPGSASKVTTKYFGNEATHDFDGDGRQDIAFLLTQNSGGSGTFYYVVVALNKVDGYVGTQSTLIGDRIAPQTTEVNDKGFIVVNFADRKPGESFAVQPSVGKSLWFKFDSRTNQLGEVVQNFEGEADSSKMTLGMKTWKWVNTKYNDGKVVTPKKDVFTIAFDGKRFSVKTDCNMASGEYVVSGNKITFDKMMSTLMACEFDSQESVYTGMLSQVQSFLFTSKGELILSLKMDSGSMVFK